ncbi:MAG: hypothetical protein U5K56_01555 [Halioglobus sp.]|nr:hypothetical protein [Halioglobus sp.]
MALCCWSPRESGSPIDLSAIDVSGIGDGAVGNEFGLNFSFGPDAGFTIGSETSADSMSLLFSYRVTATMPGSLINGISLADANAAGAAAFVEVLKFAADAAGSGTAAVLMEVFSDTSGTGQPVGIAQRYPGSEIFVGRAFSWPLTHRLAPAWPD